MLYLRSPAKTRPSPHTPSEADAVDKVHTDHAEDASPRPSPAPPPSHPTRHLSPRDLLAEGGTVRVDIDTPVALAEEGPFEPIGRAIERTGALRDELAREIAIPSLRTYPRVRIALLAATVLPMAMLLELDRELIIGQNTSVGRVLIDLLLVAFVVFELSRRTPRMPRIAAMALSAIALRWTLIATRLCGAGVHVLVYTAAFASAAAAIVLAAHVPSRSRVALELLDKIGITRSEWFAATTSKDEPPGALIAAAVACAAGLPAILHLTRSLGAGLVVQAIVFVGFGILAPIVVRRLMDPVSLSSSSSSSSSGDLRADALSTPVAPARIMMGVVVGLTLTAAAVTVGRLFFDVGGELARCVDRLDAEARFARGAEAAELANAVAKVRASVPLVVMTAAVFPFAEERIYRGLLQDVLARKYGSSYGVFAASLAFGVAHLGIYQVALYQTVLLGIGFGVAYAEGGLLAAFFVHATWNLLQLS